MPRIGMLFACITVVLLLLHPAASVTVAQTEEGAASTEDPQAIPEVEPLPWRTTRPPARIPGRRIENARQFLELLGVDASQWSNLFHDQPLSASDEEWIHRILFRLPRVGAENLFLWRKNEWQLSEILAQPEKFQGDVFALQGRATKVERIPLPPEVIDRYDFSHYFRVHIKCSNGADAIVCTRNIPQAWQKQQDETLDERIAVDAVFLKLSPREGESPALVCAALRVAWLPDRVDAARGISAANVALAEQGFDYGLWDSLHGKPSRGLQDSDREPFYHLLGALASNPPLKAAPPLDIAAAIRTPNSQRGELVTVRGTVRRIDQVEVSDSEMQARFGLKHYYTLFVFVPLENLKVRLANHEKSRLFENQFPVTVCVSELPSGLTPGPVLHEPVEMQGVYYRIWNYKPSGADEDLLQPSPLIVGGTVKLVLPEESQGDSATLGFVFIGLIVLVALTAWWFSRGDARFKREMLEKRILKEDEVDLRDLSE